MMSKSSFHMFLPLALASLLFFGTLPALGEASQATLTKLEQNLCAVKPTQKKPKQSEAGCEACDLKSAAQPSKLTGVEKKTTPIANAITSAVEKERIQRELAFFKLVDRLNAPPSIETISQELEYHKSTLQTHMEKAEAMKSEAATLKQLQEAVKSLPSENPEPSTSSTKAELLKIVSEPIAKRKKDLAYFERWTEDLKEKIDSNQNGPVKSAYQLKSLQQDLKAAETSLQETSAKLTALQELEAWANETTESVRPTELALTTAENEIGKKIEKLRTNSLDHEQSLKYLGVQLNGRRRKSRRLRKKPRDSQSFLLKRPTENVSATVRTTIERLLSLRKKANGCVGCPSPKHTPLISIRETDIASSIQQ